MFSTWPVRFNRTKTEFTFKLFSSNFQLFHLIKTFIHTDFQLFRHIVPISIKFLILAWTKHTQRRREEEMKEKDMTKLMAAGDAFIYCLLAQWEWMNHWKESPGSCCVWKCKGKRNLRQPIDQASLQGSQTVVFWGSLLMATPDRWQRRPRQQSKQYRSYRRNRKYLTGRWRWIRPGACAPVPLPSTSPRRRRRAALRRDGEALSQSCYREKRMSHRQMGPTG